MTIDEPVRIVEMRAHKTAEMKALTFTELSSRIVATRWSKSNQADWYRMEAVRRLSLLGELFDPR